MEKRCWKPGVEVCDSSLLHGEGDAAHYNEGSSSAISAINKILPFFLKGRGKVGCGNDYDTQ